jgi:hypothetical protein
VTAVSASRLGREATVAEMEMEMKELIKLAVENKERLPFARRNRPRTTEAQSLAEPIRR